MNFTIILQKLMPDRIINENTVMQDGFRSRMNHHQPMIKITNYTPEYLVPKAEQL